MNLFSYKRAVRLVIVHFGLLKAAIGNMVMLPKDAVKKQKWTAGHRDDFPCCRVCDRTAALI